MARVYTLGHSGEDADNTIQYYKDLTLTSAELNTSVLDSDFSSDGVLVRTSLGSYTNRTIEAGSSALTITNGNGVSGNPVIDVSQSNLDHGSISGLSDDDHTQYHNDSRALTWIGTRSTSDLPEGINLYYTNERVDDRVAALLQDSASVTWTYDDAAGTLSATSVNEINDLSDVSIVSLAEGYLLRYNDTTNLWESVSGDTFVSSAGAVMDTDFVSLGLMVKKSSTGYISRAIAGTSNQVTVSNGDGVLGNPTLSLPQDIHTSASPLFASATFSSAIITTDTFDINGDGPGDQTTGLYVSDSGTTVGATNNPTYTAIIGAQLNSGRSIALSVDLDGYIRGFRSHSSAGTYTFESKVLYANDLENLSTLGLVSRTASGTFTGRTITGTSNQVVVSNGNGVSGDPTLSLPQDIHSSAAPTFGGLTVNGDLQATNVGVGGAPDFEFHIQRASSDSVDVMVENTAASGDGDANFTMLSAYSGESSLNMTNFNGATYDVWSLAQFNDDFVIAYESGRATKNYVANLVTGAKLLIQPDGKIGIGTNSPDEKLHVEGSVLIDAYNAGVGNGIFFREGFASGDANPDNLAIRVRGLGSPASPDGLELCAYDGIVFRMQATDRIKFYQNGGSVWGTASGGNKGPGTINAQAVYDDNTLLTDYVFEKYYLGYTIESEYSDYKMNTLDDEILNVSTKYHLSTMPSREEFEKSKSSTGEMVTRLWETVETQFIYITQLHERLNRLENK